jgi:hypothetical protein
MAIPGERDRSALSNPTQTGVKGLRALEKILLCRSAARPRHFRNRFRDFLKFADRHRPDDGRVRDIGLKISSA